MGLLQTAGPSWSKAWADGKRLKPREVVAEFDTYLHDELDLVREAANAAQLRRNMQGLELVLVPEMVWDLCTHRDGDGAHGRHPDQPDRALARRRCRHAEARA